MCLENTGWWPPHTYPPHHLYHILLQVILHSFCLIRCLSICPLLSHAPSLSLILTHMLIHFVGRSQSIFELLL